MFERPLSIKELLPDINTKYFLPAIQREYVWKEEQIISLFDSMLKGYPIGSFLFWKVNGENIKKYDFYKFCENQTKRHINESVLNSNEKTEKHEIISILDGQQRITSLLIGFVGNYNDKELYVNLSSKYEIDEKDEYDLEYKFEFKSSVNNSSEHWFKVKDILEMDIKAITAYSRDNNLNSLGIDILADLYDLISSKTINYYLEDSDDIQKVLTIFVRVNSGGTHLSYADLLLSMATSNWENLNARVEINNLVEEINNIGNGFKITKDFLLKTSLYLLDREIKFKVSNYEDGGMQDIENNWDKIKETILETFYFLSEVGFWHKNLNSNYAASVISYYKFKFSPKNFNKENILIFLRYSLLKGIYSSSLDTVLKNIRESINKSNNIVLNEMNKFLPDNKQLIKFKKHELEKMIETKYTQKNFNLLMSILYSDAVIHTEPLFTNKDFDNKEDERLKVLYNYKIYLDNKKDKFKSYGNSVDDVLNSRKKAMVNELLNVL